MDPVRSSDRLKKKLPASSRSSVPTNQGAASASGGSTKKAAASKATKTTRRSKTSEAQTVVGKTVRRRATVRIAEKKGKKSQPQSVEGHVDDSDSDEQEMTNIVTDVESEQRGKEKPSHKNNRERISDQSDSDVNYSHSSWDVDPQRGLYERPINDRVTRENRAKGYDPQ